MIGLIHPTAVIDKSAIISDDVSVGPYAYIGPDVVIKSGCYIGPHVNILKDTTIGYNNTIHSFACLGCDPQTQAYKGEKTFLIIGDNNIIHEFSTINRGSEQHGGKTIIGDNNYFMAYTHVSHDCLVGSNVKMINNSSIAGHVVLSDGAYLSGFALVHQFCRVGSYSLIRAFSKVTMDVLPFIIVDTGHNDMVKGINKIALQRAGFSEESIGLIKDAYRLIFRSDLLMEQIKEKLKEKSDLYFEYNCFLDEVLKSSRGVLR